MNPFTSAIAMKWDWSGWLLGLWRSFISGGANAVISSTVASQVGVTSGWTQTLKLMGIIFVSVGVYRMIEFLSLHAVPDPVAVAQALNVAQAAAKESVAAIADAKNATAPKE